jgi:thymidylate synthase
MKTYEDNYFALLDKVLVTGSERPSRVGDTVSLFGTTLEVPELEWGGFPLLTTRKMQTKGQLAELAAFVRGAEDLATFKKFGCNFWDDNAAKWSRNSLLTENKYQVGRVYGVQWRDWNGVHDQLQALVQNIKQDPYGRRHILTTWNPSELNDMCLPPCHILAQFYVTYDKRLECQVYMRSVDLCLGLPSDVVLYAALLVLVANEVDLEPGRLLFSFGDAHIYKGHLEQLYEQLGRIPGVCPTYELRPGTRLLNFQPDDIVFHNYIHAEKIEYALYT